jgi:hypothetical protein
MQGPRKRSFGNTDGEEAAGSELSGLAGAEPAPTRTVISRKELARELRRQAYQRAKQARANDPRHQAMKERAKQQRRELYRKVKEQRKARDAALEAQHGAERDAARLEAKRQLAERVRGAVGKGAVGDVSIGDARASEPGRALARDIEHALQGAGVRELMERLRLESAALAAQHRQEARASHSEDTDDAFEHEPAEHD